ncbi:hypothetical protein AArcSl_0996 [Halalkaliarchaeum desulfuricum]|uniref:Uncharacterized protein n=1 Tax=Halalkaliarchaeum desulfuricum TaxID=2055893 RepID=A0A343THR2_9EURY|nr:hypothetical protein [Halalkaliarchaeum desulfuricum]AUX08634.1 hypothetical protein AArcSl_0996 [Halalkaliarchaeum desulfuricum]
MTDARTVEAETPHGAVEYDVVACTNCRTEIVPEEAVLVGIGRETYTCDGLPICRTQHERPAETRVLCSYCAEEVLDYGGEPDGVGDRLADIAEETSALSVGVWIGTALGIALVVTVAILRLFGLL